MGPPVSRFLIVEDAFALADPNVRDARRAVFPAAVADSRPIKVFEEGPDAWREVYRVLQGTEIWRSLGSWIATSHPRFGLSISERFQNAAGITAEEVARWRPLRKAIRERLRDVLAPGTALVVPTSPTPALPRVADGSTIGDFYVRALPLTAIAGHAGLPQVTVPVTTVMGAPVGLSLIGSAGADEAILATARSLFGRKQPA